MIDRDKVARAILRAEGSDISDTDEVADYHLPAADAAIAAVLSQLREPSDAVLAAGFEDYPTIWTAAVTQEDRVGIWQAMLDAAFPTRTESTTPAE